MLVGGQETLCPNEMWLFKEQQFGLGLICTSGTHGCLHCTPILTSQSVGWARCGACCEHDSCHEVAGLPGLPVWVHQSRCPGIFHATFYTGNVPSSSPCCFLPIWCIAFWPNWATIGFTNYNLSTNQNWEPYRHMVWMSHRLPCSDEMTNRSGR